MGLLRNLVFVSGNGMLAKGNLVQDSSFAELLLRLVPNKSSTAVEHVAASTRFQPSINASSPNVLGLYRIGSHSLDPYNLKPHGSEY